MSTVWSEVKATPQPVDRWLGRYFHEHRKRFGSRDRRFLSETLYALFRHKSYLECWAHHLKHPCDARLLCLLAAAKEGLVDRQDFEALIISFVPSLFRKSVYDKLAQHALPGREGFPSDEEAWALTYSFPSWIVKRWIARYGAERTKDLLVVMQSRPPLVIRVNTLKISREKLLNKFQRKGWEASPTCLSDMGLVFKERFNVFDTDEFREGFFEIQDEGSQLVAKAVGAKAGEILWDVCAGGGGKSLLLAAMMKNKGRIIATDIRSGKLEDLKRRAARAGVNNIFPADLARIGEIHEVKRGVDKILVDAPCSGTGTLRRNPDAKWRLAEDDLKQHHQNQVGIVENALPYLRTGGRLYYVTCSLEREENEEVIQEVLAKHPFLASLPYPHSPDGYFRLFPGNQDGFFLAILEKGRKRS